MQSISDRLESLSSLKIDCHTPSCTEKHALPEMCTLPASCIQVSALLTASGTPRSPTGRGITARELDSDLGLWQALPQELFPSKRTSKQRTEFSYREGSQQPTSPSMLSVATAPSDGGTIRFGRTTMELSSAHSTSRGALAMSLAGPQDTYPVNPVCCTPQQDTERSILTSAINDAATSPITSLAALCDFNDRQQASTHLPLPSNTSAPHPSIPVGGAALNAVPECNSSLETPDSCGLTQSSSRMLKGAQSVMPCMLESFKESPAEQIVAHPSLQSPSERSGSESGYTISYRNRGSSASSTQSTRSSSRRKGGGDAAPMVQYGFQSPRMSFLLSSTTHLADHKSDVSAAHANTDPHPRLTVGTGPPRKCGLLSASLSQCASNCTSPHAVSPTVPAPSLGLPSQLARLSFTRRTFDSSSSPPRSSAFSPSGGSLRKGSLFAGSPINLLFCERCSDPVSDPMGEGTTTTASGCSPSADSPVSTVSAVIPEALQVQMLTMGYHRPSRVLTERKRN